MKNQTEMNPARCGCCEGIEALANQRTASRPGLPALPYRAGTHATFLESMLARLSSLGLEVNSSGAPAPWQGPAASGCRPSGPPGDPCAESSRPKIYPLRAVTTRSPDDPAIAFLDAWALVADVLSFYQERIANEGYLRTAVERRSVEELARLVGYQLRPGLAASVYLAFTLEKDFQVEIPTGTRAQSVPEGTDTPQTFETVEPIAARYSWNAISANQQRPQYIAYANADDIERIYVEGLGTQLGPNNPLLFVFGSGPDQQVARFVQRIEPVVVIEPIPGAGYTIVELQPMEGVRAAREMAARLLNLTALGVNPTTITARTLVPRLEALARARSGPLLIRELGEIEREAAAPLLNPGPNLTTWLNSLRDESRALRSRLEARPSGGSGLAQNGAAFPFLAQAAAQVKTPALRYAGGAELPRSAASLLATPGAAAVPAMLTHLQPRLAKTFYAAWGSAQAAPNSALQEAAALRIKTAPFGHNASLKPVYDEEGALIDQREWPLNSAVQFEVEFPAAAVEFDLAVMRVKALGQTHRRSIGTTGAQTIDLPLGQVNVDFVDPTTRVFAFEGQGLQQEIQVLGSETALIVLDGEEIAQLSEGQQEEIISGTVRRTEVSYQRGRIRVVDETPLPPARLDVIDLESAFDQILPGSWVLIDRPIWDAPRAFQVLSVRTPSKNAYGLSGKTTRLELSGDWLTDDDVMLSDIRETVVYAQSEALTLVDERYDDPVEGAEILLDGLYDGLESGRWIFVSGERVDIPGARGVEDVELAMIAAVRHIVPEVEEAGPSTKMIPRPGSKTLTLLELAQPLDFSYDRKTVKILANVSKATHGETHHEILGSGDARRAFQSFALRQSPLTYVPSALPSGAGSTLELRVNNLRWPEVRSLLFLGPNQRGYELRREDDGKKDLSSAVTGDGWRGARPSSGSENITAIYRSGLGKAGNVAAGAIRNLVIRPLGVRFVSNPQRASGGADRDDRDAARRNAPLAVTALDRLVSTQDYEDFARTFAGIGKAQVAAFPRARGQLVHVTVAGVDNIPIDRNSELLRMLNLALQRYGDPMQPFEVAARELLLILASAGVRLLPDYRWISVEPEIRAALLQAFGFARRELGQPVYASEITAVVQRVPGVAYVDLDFLEALSEEEALDENQLLARLPASLPSRPKQGIDVLPARQGSGRAVLPAQLAIFSPEIPETLILTELT